MDRTIRKPTGRGIPLRGDSIDTDRIMPARYLRCVTFQGLEEHVFEDDRKNAEGHPFDDPAYRGASVLVVDGNFGCGSSREHAPQGLQRWGIRAVVGKSFSEIFFGNCVSLGLPCVTLAPADVETLQGAIESEPRTEVVVDIESRTVEARPPSGAPLVFPASIPDGARERFLRGTWDAAAMLLDEPERIDAVARSLPYTRNHA